MAFLTPGGRIRIHKTITDENGFVLDASGNPIPQSTPTTKVFAETDEKVQDTLLPAYILPFASVGKQDGLNLTVTVEGVANAQGLSQTMTFEVDGLREEDAANMAEAHYVVLDAGDEKNPQTCFFGGIDTFGYNFSAGRDRWTFNAIGTTEDYDRTVHFSATRDENLTIGDALDSIAAQAGIPILVPPEAYGNFSRILPPGGFIEPVQSGPTIANVAADVPFIFDGKFRDAVKLLVDMLRAATRTAKGIEQAWQFAASASELRVIIANLSGGPDFNPQADVDLSSPDIISAGLVATRKAAQPSDATASDGAAPAVGLQYEYSLVLSFDPRVFIGLVINVKGGKVRKRDVTFIVQSYKHTLGGKGGWRTECKGTVFVPDVPTVTVYAQ